MQSMTCILWDMEDCPIPEGLDPASVYENIQSALANNGYGGEVTIHAIGDKNQIPGYFESAGIELIRAGDRHARRLEMTRGIFGWTYHYPESNLMVISRDSSDFSSSLESCWLDAALKILIAQPRMAPRRCRNCRLNIASAEWLWETLAVGGDPIVINEHPSL
ncbi:unnamed protein product [Thlaspi arvense]|uniref:NYN domain-containing protein n=1 Tax=Thlaspi arvense TaxID=13288 RepID=A0AAU9SCE5_THLAR|nr:unnamed protein product [Thlaspi arvense]